MARMVDGREGEFGEPPFDLLSILVIALKLDCDADEPPNEVTFGISSYRWRRASMLPCFVILRQEYDCYSFEKVIASTVASFTVVSKYMISSYFQIKHISFFPSLLY